MTTTRKRSTAGTRILRFAATAALAAAIAGAAGVFTGGTVANASVPTGAPVFGAPTTITNLYFPFVPGAVKVFRGRAGAVRGTDVDVYLPDTRNFTVGAATVSTSARTGTAYFIGQSPARPRPNSQDAAAPS